MLILKLLLYAAAQLVLMGCELGLVIMITRLPQEGLDAGWRAPVLAFTLLALLINSYVIAARAAPLWKRVIA